VLRQLRDALGQLRHLRSQLVVLPEKLTAQLLE
jgi:hypothetical protein